MAAADPIIRERNRQFPKGFWIGAAIILAFVSAAFSDDPAEDGFAENPQRERQADAADPTVYRWVFGNTDVAAARQRLETLLSQRIELVDRICSLTEAQKQKLQLAGRGDNKRLLDRLEEIGTELQRIKSDKSKAEGLFQDATAIKRQIGPGVSPDMLFVKSLEKTLATEQLVRYEPLRAVLTSGGTVQPWLQKSVDVLDVTLNGTKFADGGLARLSELPGLQYLALSGTQITDAGLVHLKRLTGLRIINLDNTRITDAGVAELRALTNLEELHLSKTLVTDAGLADLKGLAKLKFLGLADTRVTDAGLAHLQGLANISFLILSQTQVTDAGLLHLKGWKKLEVLWLPDTQVTDEGLVHLRVFANLTDLRLGGTRVSDVGLAHLKENSSLGILTLDNTAVTGAGIAELQRALPDLTVSKKVSVQGSSSRKVP